ncbi:CRE-ATX-3 protein [Caenorhabditis remanei]|uniref:ubiquitinyl hydrolase 1 n=1 Tax=Caenorhabditis remanei TaxID=31234 RepID=E3LJP4_CAERE|nr:CRE-ATX-3 protein [Caenorhabditis remanei]
MSGDDPIRSIIFERQEAALCAQHALNMLIQDHVFNYESLTMVATQMDLLERSLLGENAIAARPSENMNASGFFSIQVIQKALEAYSLQLVNIEHPSMAEYKASPIIGRAYICNLLEHWFVIRRFGNQWFELNSVNTGPRLLSNTFVTEYLRQLSAEGYSTFVVQGELPASEADQFITLCPVVLKPSPKKELGPVEKFVKSVGRRLGGSSDSRDSPEERELAIAMAMSMETSSGSNTEESEDAMLKKAIEMSLEKVSEAHSAPDAANGQELATSSEATEMMETPILSEPTPSDTSSSESSTPRDLNEEVRRKREKLMQQAEKKNEETE